VAQFGSDRSVTAQNQSLVIDANGNAIISPDNSFGASPLGVAARSQVEIGLPNGTFNLLPSNPNSPLAADNLLPYWDLYQDEGFEASMAYDTTLQTWSVRIDPTAVGTAPGTAVLRTRVPIINDEGLDVRHYVSGSLIQGIKVAGGSKWTAVLNSQYYDATGAAIGTPYPIGTVLERGTATSLAGYTNASGAITASAAELEVYYTVTVGTASPTYYLELKSVSVATQYGAIGGGTAAPSGTATIAWQEDLFTSSGTWTRPAGVNYVTVVAMGGGAGGQSGNAFTSRGNSSASNPGTGGATGAWVILRDVYVDADVSIGIGAGGAGGTATTAVKAAAGTASVTIALTNGSAGGASTFGSFLSVGGGGGTAVTATYYGREVVAGTSGNSGSPGSAANHAISGFTSGAPFTSFVTGTSANIGATGASTGASSSSIGASGSANTGLGLGGVGGIGGTANGIATPVGGAGQMGALGASGAGGGGVAARIAAGTMIVTATGGAGGTATNGGGAGGGAGGNVAVGSGTNSQYDTSTITMTTGKGGDGGGGFVIVAYLVNL